MQSTDILTDPENGVEERYARTEALLGSGAIRCLKEARVILFGVGGVGCGAAEALARGGIGHITLVDPDKVCESNLNRQLVALYSTLGKNKAEVMRDRILDINPDCNVKAMGVFYSADTADVFDFSNYDYVIDAIDTVSAKLLMIEKCLASGTRIVSSMGTGGKLHPEMLRLADIFETEGCPLARVMRRELRKRGIKSLTCVYSPEEPRKRPEAGNVIGTVSFVPPVAGYILAGKVIRDILGER